MFTTMLEYVSTLFPFRAYEFVILLFSSLLSDVITRVLCGGSKEKEHSSKVLAFSLRCILYALLYVVAVLIAVFFYACARNQQTGADFISLFKSFAAYLLRQHMTALVIIPFFVALFSIITNQIKPWVIIPAMLIYLFMVILSAFLISTNRQETIPLEPELLAELKQTPFTFDTKFYDVEHFLMQANNGYPVEGMRLNTPGTSYDAYDLERYEYLLNLKLSQMGFEDIIECVRVFSGQGRFDEMAYLARAYELYQRNPRRYNSNSIGSMWFYKGRFEAADFYANAAEVFLGAREYYNAALSYYNLYLYNYEKELAGYALEYYLQSLDNNEEYAWEREQGRGYIKDNVQDLFKSLYLSGYYTDYIDLLRGFCKQFPEDVFLNAMCITYDITQGYLPDEGRSEVEYLLSRPESANCPKLLILEAYYGYRVGSSYADICNNAYSLQDERPDYFEPEDRMNLMWLLYESGEYIKAYMMALKQRESEEFKERAALIMVESYLQDSADLPEVDKKEMYVKLKERIEEMDPSRVDDVAARMKLSRLILAGRLGYSVSDGDIRKACESVFSGQNINSTLIYAMLDYWNENYAECVELCNKLLADYDGTDYSYHRLLFLKSDALIGMAKQAPDQNSMVILYGQAEAALLVIRNAVGNDYIQSLERLRDLYVSMPGRDEELQSVAQMITALN